MLLALLAAIVASVGYGVASVLEAVAALRHHGARVFTRPIYLAGIALDLLAWVVSRSWQLRHGKAPSPYSAGGPVTLNWRTIGRISSNVRK